MEGKGCCVQVAHHVQMEWPFPERSRMRSHTEVNIFYTIQLMGYIPLSHLCDLCMSAFIVCT